MSGAMSAVVFLLVLFSPALHSQVRCDPPQELQDKYIRLDVPRRSITPTLNPNLFIYGSPSSHETSDEYPGQSQSKPYGSRQITAIRNPNYKSANEKFDSLAQNMFIYELPAPHPGAAGGSTNGCLQFKRKIRFTTTPRA